MMIDENYLISLNKKCSELRSKYKYAELAESDYRITYLPTKKTSFLGYKKGYFELLQLKKAGLKESDKLRANCMNYLKLFWDEGGKIVQIKNIKGGRIDCVHQAFYEADARYLFPFADGGGYYPTYSYVTRLEGDFACEEYMVTGNQIVYERYKRLNEQMGQIGQIEQIEYEAVNFVIGGTHPVLSRDCGVFTLEPLEYKLIDSQSWFTEGEK